MKLVISLFIFVFSILISNVSSAQCGLSIAANDITVEWDATWTIQSVSITVSKTNPAACTFGLGFTKGTSGTYTRYASNGGLQLFYQLYNDNAGTKILKDAPDTATVDDVVMVTLPAGSGPQVVQYFFDIPYALATSPFLAHAGTYLDSFTINAYEGTDPALFVAPPATSAVVNLTVNIEKLIKLSFSDLGGIFVDGATTKSINFGKLTSGELSRFNLAMQTNAGFSITMSSANAGNLKHLTSASLVPYTIEVNNVPADLTGATPVASGGGQTSISGLIYPVKITVGVIPTAAIAGDYADVITVTAVVTE